MRITAEEMEKRKERIIESAFRLFCRQGIEKVSILDVAREAHVGDTTIYRYFTNKPMLVLSTLSVLWKSIGESLERKAAQTQSYDDMTGFEQLKVQLDSCRQLYRENADYVLFSYESKLYLQRNGIHLTAQQYDSLMEEIKISYLHALDKGKQDGSIPVQLDSVDVFYVIWGAVRGYIVKIVIYQALCEDDSPWERRYSLLEEGILCSLSNGWHIPEAGDGSHSIRQDQIVHRGGNVHAN